jgi:uncharacterized membrane protein YeaQ/YmgE (transglycosylase-associated protein family)
MCVEDHMGIVSWAVVGLIAGFIAGKYLKSKGSALIGSLIIGMIGGLAGGYLSTTALHLSAGMNGISVIAMLIAFIAALFVLVVVRLVGESRDKALSQ